MRFKVVRLVQQSGPSKPSAKNWSVARRALIMADGLTEEQADYCQVVQAMAWDTAEFPGSIRDVVTAWESAARGDSYRSDGWSEERKLNFNQLYSELQTQAIHKIKDKELDPVEIPSALRRQIEVEFEAEGKLDVLEEGLACKAKSYAAAAASRDQLRALLLEIL